MGRYVPVEILERVHDPIFITDERGRVELCNSAAAALLNCGRADLEGRRCWEITGLRSPEGKPLCSPHCLVQRKARKGLLPASHPALLQIGAGRALRLDVVSFAVSPPRGRRLAILHVLTPSSDPPVQDCPEEGRRGNGDRLNSLSPREHEILTQLASGRHTEEIAQALFLSAATVRNHVRSILSKLNVHSRIEAVLTSFSTQH